MKSLVALAFGLAVVGPTMSIPTLAAAQSARAYGSGDICRRGDAAARGVPGAVKCAEYPRGVTYHRANCRWVQEYYGGAYHDFEICQDRDGVWRPSGRG